MTLTKKEIMKKITLVLVILFTLFSCNKKENQNIENLKKNQAVLKENSKTIITEKSQKKDFINNENDTIIIENQTAVIFEPTDKSIEKRKKEIGEEDFYTGADDYMWYLNESNEYLKTKKIKILFVKNDKILKFIENNKNLTIINLSNENELWGIYLFDSKQKPKSIDMTNTSDEYMGYFNK